ncbi:hypothetical protein [Hyphomicrobium sp.]|jgi:hypothetical protein|uniref:hypothetical protein n=1 Tax=Hyphomicrobium sp. TaxID=82 RepID=UPI002C37FB1A|nr:hypothetical protein [Hyphomicrobium sp.]HVZ03621.1 hypothetical protein [Hyphomicrobium sp.]
MLGDLIAQLDRPELAAKVLGTLDPDLAVVIETRAAAASMTTADFVAGAVRAFIDSADDDLWFQMLTVMRKTEDPGLTVVQTVLKWVATERQRAV